MLVTAVAFIWYAYFIDSSFMSPVDSEPIEQIEVPRLSEEQSSDLLNTGGFKEEIVQTGERTDTISESEKDKHSIVEPTSNPSSDGAKLGY